MKYPYRHGPSNCTIHISHLVKKLCQDGELKRAIQTAAHMQSSKLIIPVEILYFLVQECTSTKDICLGRQVDQLIIGQGLTRDAFLGTHLIRMFDQCGSLCEAVQVFGRITNPSVFAWNALISALIVHGEATRAIQLFHEMQCCRVYPDQHIFVSTLKACAKAEALLVGMLVHADVTCAISKPNSHVSNILVDMYMKCHSVEDGRCVFENVSTRDTIAYTTLIIGYAEHGCRSEAMETFLQMQCEGVSPNSVTYVSIFKACSGIHMLDHGIFLHSCMCRKHLEMDLALGNTLICMYAKCQRLHEAHTVFSRLPNQDMVSWNTLIGAYAEQGHGHDASLTFHHMQVKGVQPDDVTFLSIIKACSTMPSLEHGNLVYTYVINCGLESSRFVGNSLIDMYFKCGSMRDAYGVFDCILERDIVSWNTLIVGNIDHQRYKEAFVIFKQMVSRDMDPDHITFDSLLEASILLASMHYGRLVHFCIVSSAMESDLHLSNTLIDFYTAFGRVEDACNIVGRSPEKSTGKWNTIMLQNSAAFHDGDDFCSLPNLMQEDMLPSILKACSDVVASEIGMLLHSYLIESSPGRSVSISNTFIDMYLKCGNLEDACCVFKAMPERDVVTWTMMIGGYGNRGDYESANRAFKRMLCEGHKPVEITYICLLNACARAGLLNEGCFHLQSMMEVHGLAPTFDHYFAMVNLLGQLGRLAEAEDIIRTIPVSGGDIVGVRTLLNHCKVHGNEILGQQYIDP